MKSNSILSDIIRTVGYEVPYDASCKRVLANKELLARTMKECIDDFKKCKIRDIVNKYIEGEPLISTEPVNADGIRDAGQITGMATEDKSLTEGTVTFDIKFAAFTPKGEKIIVNIEAQNKFNLEYLFKFRGGYYCARMVTSQNGTEFTHSEYHKIKRVYNIWICPYPTKDLLGTIVRKRNHMELEKNGKIEILDHDDLTTTILVCLGERSEEPTLTDLLEVALSNKIDPEEKIKILEEKYSIPMTIELEEEVVNMCNLSQGIKEEGIEIGIDIGDEKRIIISIENLMRTVNFSLEQAMYALDIPEADRAYYANAINGK
jgi:hypothetical protein